MELLKTLNAEQKKAVTYGDGPLLIVAGAGTGKTTVITQRLAWLIAEGRAKSDEILAVTFTDKAAGEMEERVDRLLPLGYLDLWVSTFHSFCQRVLEAHALDIGLPNDFKLLDSTSQWLLVRQQLDRFDLDYYRPLGNPTKFIHALLKHFSRAKDEAIGPEEYLEYVENLRLNLDRAESAGGGIAVKREKLEARSSKSETNSKFEIRNSKLLGKESFEGTNLDVGEITRLGEVAEAYHVYQQILLENDVLDFGDLINYTLKLFQERPAILEKYRSQFKYILVDEFQDTNWAQYELIKLLASPKNNLTVVADDDQCLPGSTIVDTESGKKRIDEVKKGEKVVTGVGKGYVSLSRVNHVMKRKKKARFITLKTEKGYSITATDNHKFFVHTPSVSNKKYYFVYLMNRDDIGWRIGVTNCLTTRLRLERSADKIIALRSFSTEKEARYFETLWSLRYGIPTGIFEERDGVMLQGDLMKRLYKELDVEQGVSRLISELGIDLESHHFALAGVKRGSKSRIKIHLELCQRRYSAKTPRNRLLLNSEIRHFLALETSDEKIISILRKNGYRLNRAKKGYFFKKHSQNIEQLGKEALKLQRLTGGIIDHKCNIGKTHSQHLPALIMPLKNVCPGLYIPVRTDNGIIYDQVVERIDDLKEQVVYDLEIDRTHNFVANGVVVHNSVYKFRGASVSNLTQFNKDYPKAEVVSLVINYRSRQEILDTSYNFIQLNNPNRLEAQSLNGKKVDKKLKAHNGVGGGLQYLVFEDQYSEARGIVEEIKRLRNKEIEGNWNDFAVLVRANAQADIFIQVFEEAGIPYQFVASRGLYTKRVVLDIVNFLKLLDDYHESPSMWRVLNWDVFNLSIRTLVGISHHAKKKSESLYQTIHHYKTSPKLLEAERKTLEGLIALIEEHTRLAQEKKPREVVLSFLEKSGYLKWLASQDDALSRKQLSFLEQFDKKLRSFEVGIPDPTVKLFLDELQMELDSGESGSLEVDLDSGPEEVKIMTVHASKGLEFPYVFVVNMVDKRFPAISRKDPIELPDDLVKEEIPEGDIHLEEERRLFYVALTRAREKVFLTGAQNYGGKMKKKASRFISELGIEEIEKQRNKEIEESSFAKASADKEVSEDKSADKQYELPKKFSFTQLKAFETCPYQYRFAHILKVPVRANYSLSFGKTMHAVLKRFLESIQEQGEQSQGGLFESGQGAEKLRNKEIKIPSLKELLEIYEEEWIDDWYESEKQKGEYKKKGKEILKKFHTHVSESPPQVKYLEQGFHLKIKDPDTEDVYTMYGVIDRVDDVDNGEVEIIDYKTGSVKDEKSIDKDQLLLYQIAASETLDLVAQKLTYYYLDAQKPVSFLGTEVEVEKLKTKILDFVRAVKASDFSPTPSAFKCKYCDFKNICEFRA